MRQGRINNISFKEGTPWNVKADVALPCATQNELQAEDAKALVGNGLTALAEGANMPCTLGCKIFQSNNILFAPGRQCRWCSHFRIRNEPKLTSDELTRESGWSFK